MDRGPGFGASRPVKNDVITGFHGRKGGVGKLP
jgi:hypothetical protein